MDEVSQPLGLRFFWVDPEKGLILNGEPYPLHGVNAHQHRFDKGWAAGAKEHAEDIVMIREIGATGVRLAHYQHADDTYAACDRAGLVVWAENVLVNEIRDSDAFRENSQQQLRELIKQNYNHPSILFWSLYNELRPKPENQQAYLRHVKMLDDLAHELDTTRLTTAASNQPTTHPINWIPDITAFNRYWGWYRGSLAEWPRSLDDNRAAMPGEPIGIGEHGAAASIRQHEQNPTTAPVTTGPWHPEEWQNAFHEATWRAMKDRPWLWCSFAWVMFDFAADQRNEGDHPGRNDKGLVTIDRKTKKDAFYFYQANWTDKPLVHITSRRFDLRPPGPAEIKVYSNCDTVELFVNGESLGSRPGDTCVFAWKDVPLREGRVEVRAVGSRGGKTLSDKITWTVSSNATTRPTTATAARR